jgi:hypothetical protein
MAKVTLFAEVPPILSIPIIALPLKSGILKVVVFPDPVNPYALIAIFDVPVAVPVAALLITIVVAFVTLKIVAPDGIFVPEIPHPTCTEDDIPVNPETVVERFVVVAVVHELEMFENNEL